ncbi:phage holin family protein [Megasphaera sp.]|uniref:phage holin family protein n=1 Tax=Megasphaera sp. TaxID=2023260 RepID=UPI0030799B48
MNMLRTVIPVNTEIVWGGITAVGGTVLSNFLGWDQSLEVLLVAMVIDYVTGVLAAYINPHMALNSQKGFKGICKKIIIILLVALAHELDKMTGQPLVQTMVVCFFIGNEGLSIVENAAKAGLPIPQKLRETLEQLANEKGAKP